MIETEDYWIIDDIFIFKPKFNGLIINCVDKINKCSRLISITIKSVASKILWSVVFNGSLPDLFFIEISIPLTILMKI